MLVDVGHEEMELQEDYVLSIGEFACQKPAPPAAAEALVVVVVVPKLMIQSANLPEAWTPAAHAVATSTHFHSSLHSALFQGFQAHDACVIMFGPHCRYLLLYVYEGCQPSNRLFYVDLSLLPQGPAGLNLTAYDFFAGKSVT